MPQFKTQPFDSNITIRKKPFVVVWLLSLMGAFALIPYITTFTPAGASISKILISTSINSIVIYGIVCWLGYLLVPRAGLMHVLKPRSLKEICFPSIFVGLSVGCLLWLLDSTLFKTATFTGVQSPSIWKGLLASFYGAINEEVLCRFFLLTLFFYLMKKIFKSRPNYQTLFFWVANIFVALLFGIGHLPAAYKIADPTALQIFRILLLNGVAGLAFGWLYWSRGLWAAMTAHYAADIVLHVIIVAFVL